MQTLMHHTDKRRMSAWLKDLREKQFIEWIYKAGDPIEGTKPAIYYLGLNGIRFLRQTEDYPAEELSKRYRESARQQDFIKRSLLLADCGLHLETRNEGDDNAVYEYALETDYANPDNDFSFLQESELVHPQLCFTKEQDINDEAISKTHFVEFFDASTPRYMVQKRLKGYVEYLQSDEWEQAKGDEELPIILIACPTLAELIYAKRYTKQKLMDAYNDEIPQELKIWFAPIEKIKAQGMTAVIWEDL